MFRAIVDLTDIALFDDQIRERKPPIRGAYLVSESRENSRKALEYVQSPDFQGQVWISINSSELNNERDLKILFHVPSAHILLRGCHGPADVEKASVLLTVFEITHGRENQKTEIVAAIADTARSVQSLSTWTFLPDRLIGMVFDPAALARSIGLTSHLDSQGQRQPLLETAAHLSLFPAHALSCPIYDATLWNTTSNLSEHYYSSRQMGFAGAFTRKPDNLDMIAAIFA